MRHDLDCYPCFFRQTLEASRMATSDEAIQRTVLRQVGALLSELPAGATPIEMGSRIHRVIREHTGSVDPYWQLKLDSNRQALALYPRLRKLLESSESRLETAVVIAAVGNVIDFGANPHFNVESALEDGLRRGLIRSDFRSFARRLSEVKHVLYLGDNAGEIVFDKVLVEEMASRGVSVTFAVKEAPILNDATLEDALAVGMDEVAEVVSSGVAGPGTLLAQGSSHFRHLFSRSPLILAKGQGNYEGLSQETAPLFFLLMAKCPVVARSLGVDVGDLVLREPVGGKDEGP
ncbi:MAG: ARMT1-like domain-containing protein [Gemmatimonadota bacterium]